jgi:competence protein ComEA
VPDLPISRRQALLAAALLLAALVLAGRYLSGAGASASTPAAGLVRERPAERPPVLVHVVGAVREPGLYKLRDGSRVADAVERAGGATPKADLSLVNLAAPVADGTQVVVPAQAPPAAAPTGGGPPAQARAGPVHLNTATVEELDALPGVGPVTAQKIVDFRQANGAFTSVDELDAVPGIGPARLEELRKLVAP